MSFNCAALRAEIPLLSQEVNGHPLRYLDNASTTPMPRVVLDAMFDFETNVRSNVARSGHALGERATDMYEAARHSVARYLNAVSPEEVIFTSGTTAAVNLLANSLGDTLSAGDEIIVSAAEHHSNFIPWQMLAERTGVVLKVLPVLDTGCIDIEALAELVGSRCKLVAMTHASNVTGAITDVTAVVNAAARVGARVFLDGTQMPAHGPVDIRDLGVDFYALSAHKCYGPTGIGALWGRQALLDELPPFMGGGGMVARVDTVARQNRVSSSSANYYHSGPARFEAGTPPITQAVGFGKALDWLRGLPWNSIQRHEQMLIDRFLEIPDRVPGFVLPGPTGKERRLPVFSFDIEGTHPHDVCHLLDQRGLALRGGHHCAQPLMDALGFIALSRASFSLHNDVDDIAALEAGLLAAREVLL